jgi:hypothetical protein
MNLQLLRNEIKTLITKPSRQHQLPVKCGSSGFRGASFRSCRLSA